jgi:HK97 family phage prohead protease
MFNLKAQHSKLQGRSPIINFKSVAIEAQSVDEESMTVSGYLAAFGNVDDAGDRLIKGCFAKSLKEHGVGSDSQRKILFCWQHDTKQPIGQFTALREDEKGLYFEAKLDDIPFVRDTVIPQYKSGTLNQHSIGYRYIFDKCEWVKENGKEVFECKELELFEGSVVTMGCNENTPFLGFKSLTGEQVAQAYTELDNIARTLSKADSTRVKRLFASLMPSAHSTSDEKPGEQEGKPSGTKKSLFTQKNNNKQ